MKLALLITLIAAGCAAEVGGVEAVEQGVYGFQKISTQTCMNTGDTPFRDEDNARLGRLRNYMQRFCPHDFACYVDDRGDAICRNGGGYMVMTECKANPPGTQSTTCMIYRETFWGRCEEASAQWVGNREQTDYIDYSQAPEDCGKFNATGEYQERGSFDSNSLDLYGPLQFGGA